MQRKNAKQSLLLKLIAFIISQQILRAIHSDNSCFDCILCRNCSVVVETLLLTEICGVAYGHTRFEALQLLRKLLCFTMFVGCILYHHLVSLISLLCRLEFLVDTYGGS